MLSRLHTHTLLAQSHLPVLRIWTHVAPLLDIVFAVGDFIKVRQEARVQCFVSGKEGKQKSKTKAKHDMICVTFSFYFYRSISFLESKH